jgi:crotonobetainyl-CoA:carnitine CoA-transferase CaiB-like acyl-CoA transferase
MKRSTKSVRPLDGVRVLDLTRLLPGAYATLLLADLGAAVIKIEDPRGGDPMRAMPPLAHGTSVYFELLNRNKQSVTLDLRSPDAPPVLDALAARADVLVDSFRPQTARRFGVDPETLRKRHPRLVCASITGFGQHGPYVDRAAHDINYQALGGLLTARRPEGRAPEVPRLLTADIGAALNAVAGVLAALFQRERTGAGASVDVSIHEAALSWLLFPAARWLVGGGNDDPREVPIGGDDACYNIYETRNDDEYVALGALEPKFWAAFCDRIARPDLIPFQNAAPAGKAGVLAQVRAIMRTRTRDQWLALFADIDVCLSAVNTLDQAINDPHIAARGAVIRLEGTTYPTIPIAVTSAESPSQRSEAPRTTVARALGADTDEVLDAAGIGRRKRDDLRRHGVI